ncbi:MAG: hypothetical protein ACLQHF_07995 [Terracidiphilus sp.]
MYTNRRANLSLVAHGRITPAEAERLIAASSSDREAWWLLAGCALCAGLVQTQSLALSGLQSHALTGLVHLFRPVIDGSISALHHVLSQIAARLGGTL